MTSDRTDLETLFARFVEATGHTTFAEIPPDPANYPGALPDMLYAGSLVFVQPNGPVDRRNIGNWWTFMRGADWRHPYGPGSSVAGLDRHPVVHVAFSDAEAFAKWRGKFTISCRWTNKKNAPRGTIPVRGIDASEVSRHALRCAQERATQLVHSSATIVPRRCWRCGPLR